MADLGSWWYYQWPGLSEKERRRHNIPLTSPKEVTDVREMEGLSLALEVCDLMRDVHTVRRQDTSRIPNMVEDAVLLSGIVSLSRVLLDYHYIPESEKDTYYDH